MQIPDAKHPIWSLLRITLLVITLALCLYFGYSTWDPMKDPRTIVIMAILAAMTEVGPRFVASLAKPEAGN